MTLALGFACQKGLVLAADSEMTAGSGRFEGEKIWYFKAPPDSPDPVIKVGVAGAGHLHFLKDSKEAIRRRLEHECAERAAKGLEPISLDEAENIVREVVLETHTHHIYPIGNIFERQDYNIWVLVGLTTKDGQRLLSSDLTAVNPVERSQHLGMGPDLARFLISQFGDGPLTVTDAVFLSAQTLLYAEKHLSNVGGRRRIIVLYPFPRSSGWVKDEQIREHEEFIRRADAALQPVLFGGTYKDVPDSEFVNRLERFKSEMMEARRIKRHITIEVGAGILTATGYPASVAISQTVEPILPPEEKQPGNTIRPTGELTLEKLPGHQTKEEEGS